MGKMIIACVFFLLATGALVISGCSFREKGFLFNNAYIYATKKEREDMDKRPHYRQSAVAFLLVGAALLLEGLSVLLNTVWVGIAGMAAAAAAGVYAVVSDVRISRQKKEVN